MRISKSEHAYKHIKSQIIAGKLPPLSSIYEEELQKELEISRTPIREALIQLQAESFLEIYPRRGIVVAPITFDLLNDIYGARAIVEPKLFCSACTKVPEKWLIRMQERFQNSPVPRENISEFTTYLEDLDHELCSFVLQSVGNRFFRESMRQVYDHSRRICSIMPRTDRMIDQDIYDHVHIIDKMLEKDLEGVEKIVGEHVNLTRNNMFMRYLDSTSVL